VWIVIFRKAVLIQVCLAALAWPGLSWEWFITVCSRSLEALKARLDGAVSSLVQWEASLPIAEGWNYVILKVLFHPKPFYAFLARIESSGLEVRRPPACG